MVSGGMTCVKYLLFCFNLLFAISGIALLTAGAIIHVVYAHYSNFVSDSFQWIPIIMIIVGVIIFVVAFFGCCGAVKENHCMTMTFSVLLLIIIAVEVALVIVSYARRHEVEDMLEHKLNSTMFDYYKNDDMRKTWDIVQHEAECCGIMGPSDWRKVNHNDSLPHTCCPNAPDDGTCTVKSPNRYTDSCFEKLKQTFLKFGFVIAAVGIGVALSQLIGVIFACSLACSIMREYEIV